MSASTRGGLCLKCGSQGYIYSPVYVCVCVLGVQMYVCNREHYGFLPVPLKAQQNVEDESESFIHTITEALSEYKHFPLICHSSIASPLGFVSSPS